MELDQVAFKKIHSFFKNWRNKEDAEEVSRRVYLHPLKPRLTILARALTGIQNDVITSEREGGWSGNLFYLPQAISFNNTKEENEEYYVFRVLYLSVQQKLRINWELEEENVVKSQENALKQAPEILAYLFEEYPNLEPIFQNQKNNLEAYCKEKNEQVDYTWLYGRFMKMNPHLFTKLTNALKDFENAEKEEITTEINANPSDEVQTVAVNQKEIEDRVVSNQFEKVDTLDEFSGSFKEMDGDDSLSDDEDALRELNLKHTVRSDESTHSVYKAEFVNSQANIRVEDKSREENFLFYPEWDYKNRVYKENFCKVYPKNASIKTVDYANTILKENQTSKRRLIKLFNQVNNEYEKVDRVANGDNFNLDSVIEAYIDILSGKTPNDKIYTTKRRRKKDLSVLILMDVSLSADGYTDNQKVLDIEKAAVLMFGEVMEEFNISFQVDAFSSRTRNQCDYTTVKSFKENWKVARNKVGSLTAENFTRIGAALRHAGSAIEKTDAKRKWIILLSDGKPNDYDTYEGKYGIEDVKKALSELERKHIHTFSLAIEAQAKYYLPQMFGFNNYNILSSANELPEAFGKFYKKILNS